jgi:hypothetical protein
LSLTHYVTWLNLPHPRPSPKKHWERGDSCETELSLDFVKINSGNVMRRAAQARRAPIILSGNLSS